MSEKIDYDSLLAPVPPEERKDFVMRAVMGLVIDEDKWHNILIRIATEAYSSGYNADKHYVIHDARKEGIKIVKKFLRENGS